MAAEDENDRVSEGTGAAATAGTSGGAGGSATVAPITATGRGAETAIHGIGTAAVAAAAARRLQS